MLTNSTPAFLKMLLIAAVLEKRKVPGTVALPVVGGSRLVYACVFPEAFLQDNPPPLPEAARASWRDYAYRLIQVVEFQLVNIHSTNLQS